MKKTDNRVDTSLDRRMVGVGDDVTLKEGMNAFNDSPSYCRNGQIMASRADRICFSKDSMNSTSHHIPRNTNENYCENATQRHIQLVFRLQVNKLIFPLE